MKRLVLLHGWGFSSSIFAEFSAEFDKRACMVQTPDLPGYGNDTGDFPCLLKDVAAQIATQIDFESIIVGWSLGGLIAQQIAIDFPQKVEQLVLIAATPCFTKTVNWGRAADSELSHQFYQKVNENGGAAIKGFYTQLAAMERHSLKVLHHIRRLQRGCMAEKETLLRSLKLLHSSDLRSQMFRLQHKITWIYGADDQLVPAQNKPVTNNSVIKVIARAGHVPFLTQPDACMKIIEEVMDADD